MGDTKYVINVNVQDSVITGGLNLDGLLGNLIAPQSHAPESQNTNFVELISDLLDLEGTIDGDFSSLDSVELVYFTSFGLPVFDSLRESIPDTNLGDLDDGFWTALYDIQEQYAIEIEKSVSEFPTDSREIGGPREGSQGYFARFRNIDYENIPPSIDLPDGSTANFHEIRVLWDNGYELLLTNDGTYWLDIDKEFYGEPFEMHQNKKAAVFKLLEEKYAFRQATYDDFAE